MRKLNSEETRAINQLVSKRVRRDYASLLHDISLLELSRDKAENKLREAVDSARKEAERDKSLVREYKRGFGSVSQLLSTKEQRFEGKLEQAERILKEAEENLRQVELEKKGLLAECRDKDKIIEDLSEEMAKLRIKAKQVEDYKDIVEKNESMRKEVLRLKFDLDVQKRENTRLLKDIERMKSGGGPIGVAMWGNDRDTYGKDFLGSDLTGIRRSRSTSLLQQRDTAWMPRSLSNIRHKIRDRSPSAALSRRNQTLSRLDDKQAFITIQNAPLSKDSRLADTKFQLDKHNERQTLDRYDQSADALLRKRQAASREDTRLPLSMATAPAPPLHPHDGLAHAKCAPDCRVKRDLEECKAHLARTCEQNAYLSYTLAGLREAKPGDLSGRGINLNVQLKQIGMDNVYSYRQRVAVQANKPPLPPPPPVYTAPTVSDLHLGAEHNTLHGYNSSRRVRKLEQPRYLYRK
ncbi:hypothetical protein EGW08_001588 [Elysia chlorotica]|uniref:Uncharacterized protein n=1 Tax=Elysia chlorotica TaxID=188477 RepID=A0A433UA46_ELYCH|nr:hypothetical protein EGW08_001588 [Elysia chlorotica]